MFVFKFPALVTPQRGNTGLGINNPGRELIMGKCETLIFKFWTLLDTTHRNRGLGLTSDLLSKISP